MPYQRRYISSLSPVIKNFMFFVFRAGVFVRLWNHTQNCHYKYKCNNMHLLVWNVISRNWFHDHLFNSYGDGWNEWYTKIKIVKPKKVNTTLTNHDRTDLFDFWRNNVCFYLSYYNSSGKIILIWLVSWLFTLGKFNHWFYAFSVYFIRCTFLELKSTRQSNNKTSRVPHDEQLHLFTG